MPPRAEPGSGLLGFLAVLVVPILVAAVVVPLLCVHKVEEGHIGIYWQGGALLSKTTDPGIHFFIPFLTTFANVQITLQTDTVTNIPCGTSGGVMIYFDKVEVVNRLDKKHAWETVKNYGVHYDKLWIFDKIHHEINQFCSAHSLQEVYIDKFDRLDESLAKALQADCTKYETGIEVIAIRVTKPRIPEGVERNYQLVEEQKTRFLVATQEQLVATKQAETQRIQAKILAEREAEVALINARREAQVETIAAEKAANISRIHQNKLTEEASANSQRALIENESYVKTQKALAEAESFKIKLMAEANTQLLTPSYLQKLLYESISSNTKIYFGSNIPQIFLDWVGDDGGGKVVDKILRK